MSDRDLLFWQLAWYPQVCDGGDSQKSFFDFDEMIEKFSELRSDEVWRYSITVYEYRLSWNPKEVVAFIDKFSRNEINGRDVTRLAEYDLDVIQIIRPMLNKTNADVSWEEDLATEREVGIPISASDIKNVLLTDRTVLLFGSPKEIVKNEGGRYEFTISLETVLTSNSALEAGLEVVLTANEEAVESYVKAFSALDGAYVDHVQAAIAARIYEVREPEIEDGIPRPYIGVVLGELIDIVQCKRLVLPADLRERVLAKLKCDAGISRPP